MDLPPSLRQILTKVLNDLEKSCAESRNVAVPIGDVNNAPITIESLPGIAQTCLLILHQIYPSLLLSSLDLLDNALVTRYTLTRDLEDQNIPPSIYYVRSFQVRSSRFTSQAHRTVYEIRPAAWHCTCPSFTLSAFSARITFDPFDCGEEDFPGSARWGGEMRGEQLAICKHLLAVLIGERLKVIPEKQVDINTLANYAFGEA